MILYVLFAIFIITLEYLARKEEKNNKNYYKKPKK
jgi:preprotein translocase subunit SecG